jgi:hypothetical protein
MRLLKKERRKVTKEDERKWEEITKERKKAGKKQTNKQIKYVNILQVAHRQLPDRI